MWYVLCAFICVAASSSEKDSDNTTHVEGTRSYTDTPASRTVLSVTPHTPPTTSVADHIQQAPGVYVRRTGSLGSFSSVSLRGMNAQNVAWLWDDQPLASATLNSTDLAWMPVLGLSKIEVYKGDAPLRFQSPMGGVIRLVTALPTDKIHTVWGVGYGSFHTRHAFAQWAGPYKRWRFSASAHVQASEGSFSFYNDQNTLFNTHDDTVSTRINNAFQSALTRVVLEHDAPWDSVVRTSTSFSVRDQGVAGPGYAQSPHAHSRSYDLSSRVSWNGVSFASKGGTLHTGLDVLHSQRLFTDPSGSLRFQTTRAKSVLTVLGWDASSTWKWNPVHSNDVTARVVWDRYNQNNTFSLFEKHERVLFQTAASHTVKWKKWSWIPVVRMGHLLDEEKGSTQITPRMSLVYQYLPQGHVRMHTGMYHRMPTVLERFGDGVLTEENNQLRAEKGFHSELGHTHTWKYPGGVFQHDVSFFYTHASDLIVLLQKSQNTLQASNVGKSRVMGFESMLQWDHRWMKNTLSYTWMHATDTSGLLGIHNTPVPGIPSHALRNTYSVGPEWLEARYTASWMSHMYLSKGYGRPVPQRLLHGAGVSSTWIDGTLQVLLHMENITNVTHQQVPVRGSIRGNGTAGLVDYVGYPIPGRSWYVSLTWRP